MEQKMFAVKIASNWTESRELKWQSHRFMFSRPSVVLYDLAWPLATYFVVLYGILWPFMAFLWEHIPSDLYGLFSRS